VTRLELRLLSVDFDAVRFYATTRDAMRFVTVRVESGSDWLRAVRFPDHMTDEGASLGNDRLDEQVRIRASEELVRLEAAVNVATGRRAA
jgi:hypothetical protein